MGKVQQPPGADAVREWKAALREEFPGWSIIHTTDTGRWWATRPTGRTEGRGPFGGRPASELDADTAEGLRENLREVTDAEADGRPAW
ncbi:hypothetical protein AGRA3207_002419 [Actinomadura graeca]|uniref:Uncharacterized protein n=1 Tax=Actinomadura graeca TaxID=2750812 RepID=A0ABX8QS41_9ACTN|nr:hypothetical protein [Actinomadura graeca]QXJ21557.1 hypothetical protein AGRA3207_002419 [Actinomadura graeca]